MKDKCQQAVKKLDKVMDELGKQREAHGMIQSIQVKAEDCEQFPVLVRQLAD